ncbi:MAG: DUF5719 family protein [Actinomycetota bacterium]
MRKTAVMLTLALVAGLAPLMIAPGPAAAYPTGWTLQQEVCGSGATEVDVDAFDNYVYVVWRASDNVIYFRRSTDYGVTWDAPLVVAPNSVTNEGPVVCRGASAGYVYVLCTRKPLGVGYETWIYQSQNNGESFSNIYQTDGSSNRRYLDACRMPGTNEIIYVWSDDVSGTYEIRWGVITVNGTVSPQADQISPNGDGIAGTYPTVAGEGSNNILIAWQEAQGGGFDHAHLRCNMTTNRGAAWGESYSGNVPDNSNEPDHIARTPVAFWDTSPGGTPGVVYSGEDEDAGHYYAGRYRIGTGGWTPDNAASSNLFDTGAAFPYTAACGSDPADVLYRNSATRLSRYGVCDDFLGPESVYANTNSIASARSNEDIDYCAAVTSGGKVYVRRTDSQPPDTVTLTTPDFSGGNVYRNADFTIECAGAVDDYKVTGTDLAAGQTQYDNGIEKVTYLYTINEVVWNPLPCIGGNNEAFGQPFMKDVNTEGLDQTRMLIRATPKDSAGNTFTYETPAYIYIDKQDPVSSLDVAGTLGTNGIYRSNVSCTIIPADYTPDYSEYRIENLDNGQIDSNWTRQVGPFPLTEGHWKVHYRSADKAGNVETTKYQNVTVDKTGPVCSVTRPAKDTIQTGYYSDDYFRITGTGTDANGLSWSAIYIDGALKYQTGSDFNMSWTWDLEGVTPGQHAIMVKAKDRAGNQGSFSKNVLVDSVAENWYFAEGNTLPEMDEYLSIMNPGDEPVNYQVTFMCEDGSVYTKDRSMAPYQRDSISVKNEIPQGKVGVSTQIHANNKKSIVAERPMYFVYKQGVPGFNFKGGHDVVGVNVLQKTWYFAEGTTRKGDADNNSFDEWILLQNPGSQTATVNILYMLSTGENVNRSYQVGPQSRKTVEVAADVGINQDVSAKVTSDVDIMAERAMYFNYRGYAVDGSNVVGATGPSNEWHFAEGTTRSGYQEWLTIQNPNDTPAVCTITFYSTEGTMITKKRTVAPRTRDTVDVKGYVGDYKDISTSLVSDVPVIVERPMYFIYGADQGKYWTGGESALGNPAPGYEYYVAEGTTITDFDTYYTMMNPRTDQDVKVQVQYVFPDGSTQNAEYWIEKHSRITIDVRSATGRASDVSGSIWAGTPIVVERPMYFNYQQRITGGHVASGYGVD